MGCLKNQYEYLATSTIGISTTHRLCQECFLMNDDCDCGLSEYDGSMYHYGEDLLSFIESCNNEDYSGKWQASMSINHKGLDGEAAPKLHFLVVAACVNPIIERRDVEEAKSYIIDTKNNTVDLVADAKVVSIPLMSNGHVLTAVYNQEEFLALMNNTPFEDSILANAWLGIILS